MLTERIEYLAVAGSEKDLVFEDGTILHNNFEFLI